PSGGGNSSSVPILANYLSFANTLSGSPNGGPVVEQASLATTTATPGAAGSSLSFYPQTGQASSHSAGTGGAGGNLNLFAGLGGFGAGTEGSFGTVWIGDQSNLNGMYVSPSTPETELL